MLNFASDFFKPETRNDFYIDATMKTVWAAELEVLNQIAIVCNRHNLKWHMAFGSLLGVVRHKGYIPWDDDIDICLMREDYMQLLQYLPEELPEGYIVRSPLLEIGYPEYHSCVMNSDSISIDPEHLRKFHQCPFIVGVDIFPIDEFRGEDKLKKSLFQLARQTALMVKEGKAKNDIEPLLQALEEQCDVTIGRDYFEQVDNEDMKNELVAGLWGLANEIAMSHWIEENPNEEQKSVMYLDYFRFGKIYQTKWVSELIYGEFEGVTVPIPAGYDEILKVVFGDYMVCKQSKAQHDYPFYKKQLEQLRKYVEEYTRENTEC